MFSISFPFQYSLSQCFSNDVSGFLNLKTGWSRKKNSWLDWEMTKLITKLYWHEQVRNPVIQSVLKQSKFYSSLWFCEFGCGALTEIKSNKKKRERLLRIDNEIGVSCRLTLNKYVKIRSFFPHKFLQYLWCVTNILRYS